jgi:hypothetical protein
MFPYGTPSLGARLQIKCTTLNEDALPQVHAALVASAECPDPAAHRVAFVAKLSAATAVRFVVLRAARDRAVRVHDQAAGTGRHQTTLSGGCDLDRGV